MIKKIGRGIVVVSRFIFKSKAFLPKGFRGFGLSLFFLLINLLIDIKKKNFSYAIWEFVKQLLLAEYIIKQNMDILISNVAEFGILNLLEIINSFLVLYFLIKLLAKIFNKSAGSNENVGHYALAIVFYSMAVIILIMGIGAYQIDTHTYTPLNMESLAINVPSINLDFIPFKDGILYMIQNVDAFTEVKFLKFIFN